MDPGDPDLVYTALREAEEEIGIDASKVERELGWRPAETFDTGIRKTVQWYLSNPEWIEGVVSGSYRDWLQKQYN